MLALKKKEEEKQNISQDTGGVSPDDSADRAPLPQAEPGRAVAGPISVPSEAGAAETAKSTPAQDKGSPVAKAPKSSRRLVVLGLVGVIALAAAGYYGQRYWTVGRFMVSTDDAYVRAYNTTLAAKVPGYVSSIAVDDNALVRAGDIVAMIDDGDYKLAVDSARGKVATQQAAIERFDRQITAQQANVEQARAQIVSADAAQKRTQSEYDRQKSLVGKEFASQQTFEQALAARDQAIASVQSAKASLEAAVANVDVLKAQQKEAARTLDELKTDLAKAERDLSFTKIRAPIDGTFGNRAVQVGDYVQPAQRLASLVPLDRVYVDANFKETQLAGLKAGQPVSISVDALPDHDIVGTVESLSPASGAVFSLLPPDNATGNFTKIVQRLPVRIAVPLDVAARGQLRPGMSVVVSVNTKDGTADTLAQSGKTALTRAAFATRPR